jgi:hypothetical protein
MQEAEIGRTVVQGQPEHKVSKTLSHKASQMWWFTSIIPAMSQAEVGGSLPEADPGKKHETVSEK